MLQLFVPKRNKYNNSIKLNINILFCLVLLHFEKKGIICVKMILPFTNNYQHKKKLIKLEKR